LRRRFGRRRLTAPGCRRGQRDLALSYGNVGKVLARQGARGEAACTLELGRALDALLAFIEAPR
jgi:hypothetical protein